MCNKLSVISSSFSLCKPCVPGHDFVSVDFATSLMKIVQVGILSPVTILIIIIIGTGVLLGPVLLNKILVQSNCMLQETKVYICFIFLTKIWGLIHLSKLHLKKSIISIIIRSFGGL